MFVRAAIEACNDTLEKGTRSEDDGTRTTTDGLHCGQAVMAFTFKNEAEMYKYGLVRDPNDPSRVVPIEQLADDQQGITATAQGPLEGEAEPANAISESGARMERAQALPFDLEAAIKSILRLQARTLKHDRFRTVLYCRSGLELIEVKKAFKALGRRDFCAATERQGIQPWFRKRAMAIARHFKTEEACKDIPLLAALRMSKRQPGTQQNHAAKSARNGRPSGTPAPRRTSPDGNVEAPIGDAPVTGSPPGEPTSASPHETGLDVAVSQEAIEAAATFIEAAGGCRQAASVLVRQSAKDGDKDSVKDILRGTVAAARSVLSWTEINEVVHAAELRANGAKVQEV